MNGTRVSTTGEAGDAAQLPSLLGQHEARAQQKSEVLVGDAHYGSAENYRHCQSQGEVKWRRRFFPSRPLGRLLAGRLEAATNGVEP